MYLRYLPAAFVLTLLACEPPPPTSSPAPPAGPGGSTPSAQVVGEDDWRAADTIFNILGGVEGKVVADLSAGDGYYTWRLLKAGAIVIAMDEDPTNISALQAKKAEMNIGDDRLQIRTVQPGSTGLKPNEADIALLTRPYISVAERPAYITEVRAGTRHPHVFTVVDFLQQQTVMGPPMDQRVAPDQVMDELGVLGFQDVVSLTTKLPYRFLIIAQDLPADGTL